jgi:hypothetical protein
MTAPLTYLESTVEAFSYVKDTLVSALFWLAKLAGNAFFVVLIVVTLAFFLWYVVFVSFGREDLAIYPFLWAAKKFVKGCRKRLVAMGNGWVYGCGYSSKPVPVCDLGPSLACRPFMRENDDDDVYTWWIWLGGFLPLIWAKRRKPKLAFYSLPDRVQVECLVEASQLDRKEVTDFVVDESACTDSESSLEEKKTDKPDHHESSKKKKDSNKFLSKSESRTTKGPLDVEHTFGEIDRRIVPHRAVRIRAACDLRQVWISSKKSLAPKRYIFDQRMFEMLMARKSVHLMVPASYEELSQACSTLPGINIPAEHFDMVVHGCIMMYFCERARVICGRDFANWLAGVQ